ncbi:MAG: ABC transporter substrate-binding protein [Thermoguttaceae bacterium]|nr:ABC transporter substrate-binding protein [Thermoguttaceae bacterium]
MRHIICCLAALVLVCSTKGYGKSSRPAETQPAETQNVFRQTSQEAAQCRLFSEFNVLFDWRPGVRAIGFVVAQSEGYYQEANLPPITFSWNHQKLDWEALSSGKVQFIVSSFPRAVEAAVQTKRPIIISQLIEKTSLGLVFRTDCRAKTNRLQDFQNARIGVYKEDAEYVEALSRFHDLKFERFLLAGQGYELLSPGGLDAICLHSYQLPGLIVYSRQRSLYTFVPFVDTRITLPEDCLCCDRDFANSNREQCHRFVLASWRGWLLAAKKPEKALAIWQTYCQENSLVFDEQVMRNELKRYTSYLQFHSQLDQCGKLSQKDCEQAIAILVQGGIISKENAPGYESVFVPDLSCADPSRAKTGTDSFSNSKEENRVP